MAMSKDDVNNQVHTVMDSVEMTFLYRLTTERLNRCELAPGIPEGIDIARNTLIHYMRKNKEHPEQRIKFDMSRPALYHMRETVRWATDNIPDATIDEWIEYWGLGSDLPRNMRITSRTLWNLSHRLYDADFETVGAVGKRRYKHEAR